MNRAKFKEILAARAQLAKDTVSEQGKLFNAAMRLRGNHEAGKFFKENLEGKTTKQGLEIIQQARIDAKLPAKTLDDLERLVRTVGPLGGGGPAD